MSYPHVIANDYFILHIGIIYLIIFARQINASFCMIRLRYHYYHFSPPLLIKLSLLVRCSIWAMACSNIARWCLWIGYIIVFVAIIIGLKVIKVNCWGLISVAVIVIEFILVSFVYHPKYSTSPLFHTLMLLNYHFYYQHSNVVIIFIICNHFYQLQN